MRSSSEKLLTGPAPYLHADITLAKAMRDVVIALVPASLVSIYIFGLGSVMVMAICIGGAVAGEVAMRKYKGQKPRLSDGTAVVTGLLLALTLPPVPWWAMVPLYGLGGFAATALFREYLGGLGFNRFNPAVAARLFLLAGRTSLVYMAPYLLQLSPALEPWLYELEVVDAVSKATPLMIVGENLPLPLPSYVDLLLAYKGGALAETSVLALLLGAAYLVYKKHITWHIPVSMVAAVFLLTLLLGHDPVFHVLAGGLLLGAFFMATDWVTSPITATGKLVFGVSIGILVVFFRLYVAQFWVPLGGVVFSILILNAFVPAIDRATRRMKFGQESGKQKNGLLTARNRRSGTVGG